VFFNAWNFHFACYLQNTTAFWTNIYVTYITFFALNFCESFTSYISFIFQMILILYRKYLSHCLDFAYKQWSEVVTHHTLWHVWCDVYDAIFISCLNAQFEKKLLSLVCLKYIRYLHNILHCFLVTVLCMTKMSLHIITNHSFKFWWETITFWWEIIKQTCSYIPQNAC